MTHPNAQAPSGPLAALVVATWPDGGAIASDLLWRSVLGCPLIAWPLRALTQLGAIDFCAVITSIGGEPQRYTDVKQLVDEMKPAREYGVSAVGTESMRFALANLLYYLQHSPSSWASSNEHQIIVIDASLPLVTSASLRAGLEAARRTGIAIAGESVKETLKRVDGQRVAETLPREQLRRLCSPAIFSSPATLENALEAHSWRAMDDLVSVVQAAGLPITVFDVDYPCVRVTSEDDLAIVESLLRQRESESSSL